MSHTGDSIFRDRRKMTSSQLAKGDSTVETGTKTQSKGKRWLYVLLILPFIATLWVPFYAGSSPELGGIPYFYWYQFLWVIITAIITAAIYLIVG